MKSNYAIAIKNPQTIIIVKETYLILLLKYVLCIESNYKQNPEHSRKQQLRTIVQRNARRYKILPDC